GQGQGEYRSFVSLELLEFLAGGEVPQARATARVRLEDVGGGSRTIGAQCPFTVRREANGFHKVAGALDTLEFFAGLDVPQAHRAVEAGGEELLAVRRDGHAADIRGVPLELADLLAGRQVPQPQRCFRVDVRL